LFVPVCAKLFRNRGIVTLGPLNNANATPTEFNDFVNQAEFLRDRLRSASWPWLRLTHDTLTPRVVDYNHTNVQCFEDIQPRNQNTHAPARKDGRSRQSGVWLDVLAQRVSLTQ